MNYIHLCPKHFTGVYNQIEDEDETKCKFCLIELRERMEKFGIVDWKFEMEKDRDKYTKEEYEVKQGKRLLVLKIKKA